MPDQSSYGQEAIEREAVRKHAKRTAIQWYFGISIGITLAILIASAGEVFWPAIGVGFVAGFVAYAVARYRIISRWQQGRA